MTVIADQPFEILLSLVQEHKIDPWDVDLEKLAPLFLQPNGGGIDLRGSGRGILSASTLLKIKSQRALDGNGHEEVGEELQEDLELNLPELGELTILDRAPRKLTLLDMTQSLQDALSEIPPSRLRPKRGLELMIRSLSPYKLNLEEYLKQIYQRIVELARGGKEVKFTDLLDDKGRLTVARTFLILLFLFFQGKISIRQDEHFGELYILPIELLEVT
jgi:segregation and condensation protein A